MKLMSHKTYQRVGAGKVVKGLLLGSVLGATVGWLTAPAAGGETLRRLRGEMRDAREKTKTAEGNIESQARKLAQDISNPIGTGETSAMGRRQTTGIGS